MKSVKCAGLLVVGSALVVGAVGCKGPDAKVHVVGRVLDSAVLSPLDSVQIYQVPIEQEENYRTDMGLTSSDGYFQASFHNTLPVQDALELLRPLYETQYIPFDSLDQVGEYEYRTTVKLNHMSR